MGNRQRPPRRQLQLFLPGDRGHDRQDDRRRGDAFESEGNPKIPLGEFTAEVWLTAYPIPYVVKELVLEE
jgi:hypothetical protein